MVHKASVSEYCTLLPQTHRVNFHSTLTLYMYNWNQRLPPGPLALATSSSAVVDQELRVIKVPALAAAAEVAHSPVSCAIRCMAILRDREEGYTDVAESTKNPDAHRSTGVSEQTAKTSAITIAHRAANSIPVLRRSERCQHSNPIYFNRLTTRSLPAAHNCCGAAVGHSESASKLSLFVRCPMSQLYRDLSPYASRAEKGKDSRLTAHTMNMVITDKSFHHKNDVQWSFRHPSIPPTLGL